MIGEKLFSNLSTLSASELNSCVRMSKSIFFNKRKEISVTLDFFKKNQSKFFIALQEEKKLFFTLFPEKKEFVRKELVDHFHYCVQFFEDFVLYIKTQNSKELRLEILEKFYEEKRLKKDFLKINAKRIKLESTKKTNIDSNLKLFLIHRAKFNFLLTSFDSEVFREIDIAISYLDRFYIMAKINAFQELSSNTLMNNVQYEHLFIKEIRDYLDKNIARDVVYKILSTTSKLYAGDFDMECYLDLKKTILDHFDQFDFSLQKMILSDLTNYISYLYNKNADNNLINESFEILKLQLEIGALFVNNVLPSTSFSQGVRIAIYLKEFDWINDFINHNEQFIEDKQLLMLSKAEVLYHQKKYDTFFKVLDKIKESSEKYYYQTKCLYAKALFDTKQYDVLDSFLHSFAINLRRKKDVSTQVKNSKIGFVLYLNRIISNLYSEKALQKIKEEVLEDKSVFYRNWLLIILEK